MLSANIAYAETEIVRGEVAGVIVEVTKLHHIILPIDIRLNVDNGTFDVTQHTPEIGCEITSEVVGLAEKPSAPFPGFPPPSESESDCAPYSCESLREICDRASELLAPLNRETRLLPPYPGGPLHAPRHTGYKRG